MAEYVNAMITVGGALPYESLEGFAKALASDTGDTVDDYEGYIKEQVDDTEHLVVVNRGAHNGEFEATEFACRVLGLTYTRVAEGCAVFAPESVMWDPTCDGDTVKEHYATYNGEEVVTIDEVGKLLEAYWGRAEGHTGVPSAESGMELAEKLALLVDEWEEVPPFEIVGDE